MRRLVLVAVLAVVTSGCGPAASAPRSPAAPPAPATSSGSGAKAPAIRLPPASGRFDYQIGGPYSPVADVRIVSRDRHEATAAGRYNICYVNAFQTQPEEAAFWTRSHPDLLVRVNGRPLEDADWPGEYLLDTSTASKRTALASIVGGWVDGCRKSGFAAVEPDNLDSWTRSKRRLTRAGNLAFAKLLATRAHRNGLAFAQKNTAELTRTEQRGVGFDFAIAEECQVYDECGAYTDRYGSRVIEIEYTDNPRRYLHPGVHGPGRKDLDHPAGPRCSPSGRLGLPVRGLLNGPPRIGAELPAQTATE